MAFTYDISTNAGKVRFLVGDTVSTDYYLEDDEIAYLLTTYVTVQQAAIGACNAIIAVLAREPDKKVGDLSISNSQKAENYIKLAAKLASSSAGVITGYAGGISASDKDTNDQDTDRVIPAFKREMMSPDELTTEEEEAGL